MLRSAAAMALVLLAGSTHVLSAQSTSASLTGRVTDPSKAVIVGAEIVANSTNMGVVHHTTSNASGVFQFAGSSPRNLSVGN